ncbi:unnamed protein product [Discosporangium mesarthrocarpum]
MSILQKSSTVLTTPAVSPQILPSLREHLEPGAPASSIVHSLRRAFDALDTAGDGMLDREDVQWGLRDQGVGMDQEEFQVLLDYFDRGRDGLVR